MNLAYDAVIRDRRSGTPRPGPPVPKGQSPRHFQKEQKGAKKSNPACACLPARSLLLLIAPFFGEIRSPLLLFAPYCSPIMRATLCTGNLRHARQTMEFERVFAG